VISKPSWHDLAVRMIKYSTSGKKFLLAIRKRFKNQFAVFGRNRKYWIAAYW